MLSAAVAAGDAFASGPLAEVLGRDPPAAGPGTNGQPEETFTRHQPISIPSGPQRGRECQWRHPGSPMCPFATRIHL
jgi:hypothetical protein